MNHQQSLRKTLHFGTRNDVLDDAISINGVQCTNYVKQGGVTATASSENGDAKALNTVRIFNL